MKRKRVLPLVFAAFLAGFLLSSVLSFDQELEFNKDSYDVSKTLAIPVTSSQEESQLLELKVRAVGGENGGEILVQTGQVEFLSSFLESAERGLTAAENYLGRKFERKDMVISFTGEADEKILTGYSAGAAIGVATAALLTGRQIRERMTVTGTINNQGTIGPVGGLTTKIKAAREKNYTLLVPAANTGPELEELKRRDEKIREVANLTQAVKYMLKER